MLVCVVYPTAYAPSPLPGSDFPVVVSVTDGATFTDVIRFADHTSDLNGGNWVILSGGTSVTLPAVVMSYSGVTEASYQSSGNTITIQAAEGMSGKAVTYPRTSHPVYSPTQTILYSYYGDPDFGGHDVLVRVIPVTASGFGGAANDALRGNTDPLKAILADYVFSSAETLDANGDLLSKNVGALPAGDYALVIVNEEAVGADYQLDFYSLTFVEVLDYDSTVTVPSSVTLGSDLSVTAQMSGAGAGSWMYGAVMIQRTKYSLDLALVSDGTTLGTELTCRGAILVEGTVDGFSLAGVGPDGLDSGELLAKLGEAYSGSEFSAAFSEYTASTGQTLKLTTSGLNTGQYMVLVGVWDGGGDGLVAFGQREATVSAPSPPPSPPPVGPIIIPPTVPTVKEIEAMSDLVAAGVITGLTPSQAAALMVQLSAQKAAGIMEYLRTEVAVAIVKLMSPTDAAAILGYVSPGTLVEVLVGIDASHALAILGEMEAGVIAGGLIEAVGLGYAQEFSVFMNLLDEGLAAEALLGATPEAGAKIVEGMAQDSLLEASVRVKAAVKVGLAEADPVKAEEIMGRLGGILDGVDTGTLVDVFMEMVNLPGSPGAVAAGMETMNMTKVLEAVSAWIGFDNPARTQDLATVYGCFSSPFLGGVWVGMSRGERVALYPYLDAATAVRLPDFGEYQVSGLRVSPSRVSPGQDVLVSLEVENVGAEPGAYTVSLSVDGEVEETRRLSLAPGQDQTVQWIVSRALAGSYSVDVNGLTSSFVVQAPAEFSLGGLSVTPSEVEPGVPITVTVVVSNVGGQSGSTTVELMVDGVSVGSRTVILDGGASSTSSFTVVRDVAGSYSVAVGGLTAVFTVTAPPPPQPGFPWGILAALLVMAGVVLYIRRREAQAPQGAGQFNEGRSKVDRD